MASNAEAYGIHSDTDGAAQHNNYAVQHHECHYERLTLAPMLKNAVALCIKLSNSVPLDTAASPLWTPLWPPYDTSTEATDTLW